MGETRSILTVPEEFILAPNKYICSLSYQVYGKVIDIGKKAER